jgi:hypothetical protein
MEFNKQTKQGAEGNCLNACISSILGCPIESIPECSDKVLWQKEINEWLSKEHSLYLISIPECIHEENIPYNSYYIRTGWTSRSREYTHACIYRNGELAFDPHPSNIGLDIATEGYIFLIQTFKNR